MAEHVDTSNAAWRRDSQRAHARVLLGAQAHYCDEYGGIPLDETCRPRWPCECAADLTRGREAKSG